GAIGGATPPVAPFESLEWGFGAHAAPTSRRRPGPVRLSSDSAREGPCPELPRTTLEGRIESTPNSGGDERIPGKEHRPSQRRGHRSSAAALRLAASPIRSDPTLHRDG